LDAGEHHLVLLELHLDRSVALAFEVELGALHEGHDAADERYHSHDRQDHDQDDEKRVHGGQCKRSPRLTPAGRTPRRKESARARPSSPARRRSPSDGDPRRLASLRPSASSSSGWWCQVGTGRSSSACSRRWTWLAANRSTPRVTSVTPSAASSSVAARW